ncbi:MAG: ABC transporter permease [Chloroflexota bacterium]|nr:ABC transporter permease [Chloroflexota bacterium]PLS81650.1 MAG: ABC transporter permease [Chloroflexota bacterium]
MAQFILRRVLLFIPTLIAISIVTFAIIQLPPGDFLTSYVAQLSAQGESVDNAAIQALRDRYGLGQPFYVQYLKWVGGMLRGDFGHSLEWNTPVADLLASRMPLTFLLAFATLVFTWVVSIPIGIYSAVKQYSTGDYLATFFGFLGLATPDFLLALVLMWIAFAYFGESVGGLFSPQYEDAPWSMAKLWDLLKHMWIPVIVLGTSGTAGLIRIMRANLLDELHKPYVETARSKGLSEWRLLIKYPVRVALNPFISTIGYVLPFLVSGSVIVSVVMSLPTAGPLLLRALLSQDMYLAGGYIFMLSMLTVLGTLLSDILLAWLDPRIRFG